MHLCPEPLCEAPCTCRGDTCAQLHESPPDCVHACNVPTVPPGYCAHCGHCTGTFEYFAAHGEWGEARPEEEWDLDDLEGPVAWG